jgi:hypothetical protein
MSEDIIGSWLEKAKQNEQGSDASPQGVRVVRRAPQNRGSLIMEVAEKIRPWLIKMFEGVRDENGMLMQPAHIRAVALNVAQRIVVENEQKASA